MAELLWSTREEYAGRAAGGQTKLSPVEVEALRFYINLNSPSARAEVMCFVRIRAAMEQIEQGMTPEDWSPELPIAIRSRNRSSQKLDAIFENMIKSLRPESHVRHFQVVVAISSRFRNFTPLAYQQTVAVATPDNLESLLALEMLVSQCRNPAILRHIAEVDLFEPSIHIRPSIQAGFWANSSRLSRTPKQMARDRILAHAEKMINHGDRHLVIEFLGSAGVAEADIDEFVRSLSVAQQNVWGKKIIPAAVGANSPAAVSDTALLIRKLVR